MSGHKLLIHEPPILLLPTLATIVGLNESIVLQQLQYWLSDYAKRNMREHYFEGRYWIYNSYPQWQSQFPFWSVNTIERTIQKMEKAEILLIGNFHRDKFKKAKWYSINYEKLQELYQKHSETIGKLDRPILGSSMAHNYPIDLSNLGRSISPEWGDVYTETTTENTNTIRDTNVSLCANCSAPRTDDTHSLVVNEKKEKVLKREKSKTFRANELQLDFIFKCTAVKHGMDRTWIESEFERFKTWWLDAPPSKRPCKTLGHWKQSWDTWCSRISNTLKESQPDVEINDEFLPAGASMEKFLAFAKNPDYPYCERLDALGGFDYCYVHGFPRPLPHEMKKRDAE